MAAKLVICPFDYIGNSSVSHTGLGVSVLNTVKVLKSNGVDALIRPVKNAADIEKCILADQPTHINTCALWLPTADLISLCNKYQHVIFSITCHSNIAFLQVEPNGLALLRQAADAEMATVNFHLAGNSQNFVNAILSAWERPCEYLPNLYYLDSAAPMQRPTWSGGTIRIGAFGAPRPLKNPTSSAFAGLEIAGALHTNLEFHINTGRDDGWGKRMIQSVQAIFQGLPNATLVEDVWQPWPKFRQVVASMHLMLQPSFTESFNIVTADGVREGVASVVSDVIEWAPASWKANPDNVNDIAEVGLHLLRNPRAVAQGYSALKAHNTSGVAAWKEYLNA